MNAQTASRDVIDLRSSIRFQRVIIGVLAFVVAVLAAGLHKSIGNERIVITPPTINKTFWVQRDAVSASYLYEMGDYAAGLMLNITPSNIDYKKEAVLAHTSPSFHGVLKTRMELEADRIRRDNATLVFWPKTVTPDEKTMRVALFGSLHTYVNDRKVTDKEVSYLASFVFRGGQVVLDNFEPTPIDDPFRLKPVNAVNAKTASENVHVSR
jgi:conjugal transfer pilus assembly protein TraE